MAGTKRSSGALPPASSGLTKGDQDTPQTKTSQVLQEANEFFRKRGPVDSKGNPLPMPPEDTRFNTDGSVDANMLQGDPSIDSVLIWGLENSGIDPETGKLTYYGNIEGFSRDPKSGRWVKTAPDQSTTPEEKRLPDSINCGLAPAPPTEKRNTRRSRILWAIWAIKYRLWLENCKRLQRK